MGFGIGAASFRGEARAMKRPDRRSRVTAVSKHSERAPAVRVSSRGPPARTRPARSSRAWVKPGGISSVWWVTRTVAGAAQGADVDPAEPVPEDVDGAGGGEQPAARQAQQRRLARAVGPQHHPALARPDRPVDPGQDGPAGVETEGHAAELEDRGRVVVV